MFRTVSKEQKLDEMHTKYLKHLTEYRERINELETKLEETEEKLKDSERRTEYYIAMVSAWEGIATKYNTLLGELKK